MPIVLDGTAGITTPQVTTDDGEAYAPGNILGTVSQTAGVPTGAVIQRGSNANGSFVKYADGTLTMMGMLRAQGFPLNVGNAGAAVLTLPVALISVANGQWGGGTSFGRSDRNSVGETGINSISTTTVSVYKGGTLGVDQGEIIITGRWF